MCALLVLENRILGTFWARGCIHSFVFIRSRWTFFDGFI